jgi:hypothetical protein
MTGTTPGRRVTICHRTKSRKHRFVTITVSQHAVAAHLRHGDHLGPCTGKEHGKKKKTGPGNSKHDNGKKKHDGENRGQGSNGNGNNGNGNNGNGNSGEKHKGK